MPQHLAPDYDSEEYSQGAPLLHQGSLGASGSVPSSCLHSPASPPFLPASPPRPVLLGAASPGELLSSQGRQAFQESLQEAGLSVRGRCQGAYQQGAHREGSLPGAWVFPLCPLSPPQQEGEVWGLAQTPRWLLHCCGC